jgi:hypothetical protein
MQNPLNCILDRFYYNSNTRLLLEGVLLATLYPLMRFFTFYCMNGGVSLNATADRLFYLFFIAPWFETLVCLAPIAEILRKMKVKSWIIVLIASTIFAIPHWSFTLGLYLGISFTSVYLVARRFSFLHAFAYSTAVHFIYNLFIISLYSVAS